MTRIVIDVALAAKLHDIPAGSELCDPDGRIVGYFLPATTPPFVTGVKSPLSDEELRRRRSEEGGMALADFWKELKQKHALHGDVDHPGPK